MIVRAPLGLYPYPAQDPTSDPTASSPVPGTDYSWLLWVAAAGTLGILYTWFLTDPAPRHR